MVKSMRRQTTDREKLFAKRLSNKELASKIYRQLFATQKKKMQKPIKNGPWCRAQK